MITAEDRREIQRMIDLSSTNQFSKRIGDTPTEALQLTNKKYVDNVAGYSGQVNANGTAGFLPSGWSSVKNSTGDYTVTHNLNDSTTAPMLTPSGGINIYLYSVGVNSFSYQTQSLGGGNTDAIAYFILK